MRGAGSTIPPCHPPLSQEDFCSSSQSSGGRHLGPAGCRHSWSGGRTESCKESSSQGALYLAMHQQPDGEGDVKTTFRDLGLHFLPGDRRRALAGTAAPAQRETAPEPYHLGTERGKEFFSKQTGSSMWNGSCKAAGCGEAVAGEHARRCHGLSALMGADRAAACSKGCSECTPGNSL